MDKILFYALLLLPGFVVIKVAEHLGLNGNKRSALDEILRYILVGGISVALTFELAQILHVLPWGVDFETFVSWCNYPGFVIFYFFLSILVSAALGIAWPIIDRLAVKHANFINEKLHLNLTFFEPLPYHFWNDGKEHFLIIRKNGEDLGVGFLYALQTNRQDHLEIDLTEYPEYREELENSRKGWTSPLNNILHTYIDTDTGLVIYETEYPDNW